MSTTDHLVLGFCSVFGRSMRILYPELTGFDHLFVCLQFLLVAFMLHVATDPLTGPNNNYPESSCIFLFVVLRGQSYMTRLLVERIGGFAQNFYQ